MRRFSPVVCGCGVWARVSQGGGATVEGARVLVFVLTIPFGGCEPHVRGWGLPVFWGWGRGVGEAENKFRMVCA